MLMKIFVDAALGDGLILKYYLNGTVCPLVPAPLRWAMSEI